MDPLAEALTRDLGRALPNVETSASEVDRRAYSRDLWPRHHLATRSGEGAPTAPAVVVWPKTTEDVAAVIRFAAARGTPVVPFGAGSGVCGGILPGADAIVLDLKRMSAVRRVDASAMRLSVEAGAMGLPLEESLERQGVTLGHFPSSILCSTVGGWVATRSAGQASGRYGKIEDMVLDVECVTGTGDIVTLTRRRFGPDLSALVVGSEGALAVITRATLRLHRAPARRAFASFTFPTVADGLEAMRAIYQAGLRPAVARLYDPFDASLARKGRVKKQGASASHGASRSHRSSRLKDALTRAAIARAPLLNGVVHGWAGDRLFGGALLVLVFDQSAEDQDYGATSDLARATVIASEAGGKDEGEGPARGWLEHRYAVSFRQSPALASGLFIDTFEIAAPWSRLMDAYEAVRGALAPHAFVMAHFSHAYPDGCCIYFSFAGTARPGAKDDAWERASVERYRSAWRAALGAAISAGATVSHHHGVGRSKAAGALAEIEGGLSTLRALKRGFDPHGVLNPGVLAPIEDFDPILAQHPAPRDWLDERSLLAHCEGAMTMRDLTKALSTRGHRLVGAPEHSERDSVNDWLAHGARGAPDPFADPTDHLVAGIELSVPGVGRLAIPAVPRRATGPDFAALAVGAAGTYGATVTSVTLRTERTSHSSARPPGRFAWDASAPPSPDERTWIERIKRSLSPS